MLKQPVKVGPELLEYLGKPHDQALFREEILLIGPTWIMTREHANNRKEWFAYKSDGDKSDGGIQLVTGKAKVAPLLMEQGFRPQISWVNMRACYPQGVIDTITWKRGQKSGSYVVAMLDDPPPFAQPACPKHWKVLASLEPMLFEQLADADIKSLL